MTVHSFKKIFDSCLYERYLETSDQRVRESQLHNSMRIYVKLLLRRFLLISFDGIPMGRVNAKEMVNEEIIKLPQDHDQQ